MTGPRNSPRNPKASTPPRMKNTSTRGCSSTFPLTTHGLIMLSAMLMTATPQTRIKTPFQIAPVKIRYSPAGAHTRAAPTTGTMDANAAQRPSSRGDSVPIIAKAIPVRTPCASPTERMPYILATMASEILLNSFRACLGDNGMISSARWIHPRPSLNRKKTTTRVMREFTITRRKLLRINAPEPTTHIPACCTWELTAPRTSYLDTSIQRPKKCSPLSARLLRNRVKPPCWALMRVRYCAALIASFAANTMTMKIGTQNRKSSTKAESNDAVPTLPCVHLRIRSRPPLVDLGDLRVPHHALDRVFIHIPVATEDLDRVGRDLHRRIRCEQLRDRGEVTDVRALVVDELRCPVHHRPRRRSLGLHVRDHELDALELGDRLAELLALPGISHRVVERSDRKSVG